MSVPPGTEMFQFPGFASTAYGFSRRYPQRVGCPIRTSTDQRLLAAPRGFSQRATSFLASWCQGIHQMPFSRAEPRARQPPPGPTGQGRPRPGPAPNTHTTTPLGPAGRRSDTRPPSPETHQTLIHPDKDQTPRPRPRAPGPTRRHPAPPRGARTRAPLEAIGLEPTTPCVQGRRSPAELRPRRAAPPGGRARGRDGNGPGRT